MQEARSWLINLKKNEYAGIIQVNADRLEVLSNGGLVFWRGREDDPQKYVLHVQVYGSFRDATIMSQVTGEPTAVNVIK